MRQCGEKKKRNPTFNADVVIPLCSFHIVRLCPRVCSTNLKFLHDFLYKYKARSDDVQRKTTVTLFSSSDVIMPLCLFEAILRVRPMTLKPCKISLLNFLQI